MKPWISILTLYCSGAFDLKTSAMLKDEYFLADDTLFTIDLVTRSLKLSVRYSRPLSERCVTAWINRTPRNITREPDGMGAKCVTLNGTDDCVNSVRSRLCRLRYENLSRKVETRTPLACHRTKALSFRAADVLSSCACIVYSEPSHPDRGQRVC